MKKINRILSLFLAIVTFLTFFGCSKNIDVDNNTPEETEITESTQENTQEPTIETSAQDEDEPTSTSSVLVTPTETNSESIETSAPAETTSIPVETFEISSASPETTSNAPKATTSATGSAQATPARSVETAYFEGIVFSKVYGNGGNTDAPVRYSFIELYNTSASNKDLTGLSVYYKTKNDTKYTEFKLSGTIKAGGYFLIRCADCGSNFDSSKEVFSIDKYDLSWAISLNNKEISLVLAKNSKTLDIKTAAAELSDIVTYFVATEDYYFDTGYISDLSKNKIAVRTELTTDSGYYLVNMTSANSSKLAYITPCSSAGSCTLKGSLLKEVTFSKPAGIYSGTFSLTLSAPSGYKIYYTLDGSDPTTSSTRKQYTSALSMADTTKMATGATTQYLMTEIANTKPGTSTNIGGRVVKAYATNGTDSTAVYTNTYFISSKIASMDVKIMSLSMDKEVLCGSSGFYNHYSDIANTPDTRGLALLEVFDEDGNRRGYSNVELAVSGHGSSGENMKSMRVYYKKSNNEEGGLESDLYYDIFDGMATNSKGQTITDYSRLLLRNSGNDCGKTYLRDAFMQRACNVLSVDTMAYTPVVVFINGELWGIYNCRERYSGEYVESHYGIDKDNVALLESDYSQVHTNTNAPFIVSSGIDGDETDFNTLVSYIKKTDLSVTKNYEYVASKLDIDSFIDMYCARLYFSAQDWPENNIKIWRNRASDDKSGFNNAWHFTLLDMDFGCGYSTSQSASADNFDWINTTSCTIGNIMNKLIKNAEFKKQFLARFYEVTTELMDPDELLLMLNDMVEEKKAIFQLQIDRWPKDGASWSNFNTGVSDMRTYIAARESFAIEYCCDYFGITEKELAEMAGIEIVIEKEALHPGATITVSGHTLYLLDPDGTLYGKGSNVNNILGLGTTVATAKKLTKIRTGVKQVETCHSYDCENGSSEVVTAILTTDNKIYTIGADCGALARSGDNLSWGQVSFTFGTPKAISVGYDHFLVLDTAGNLWGIGDNTYGQLGSANFGNTVSTFQKIATNVKQISAGRRNTAYIDNNNDCYVLGDGRWYKFNNSTSAIKSPLKLLSNVAYIYSGEHQMVMVTNDGKLYYAGWRSISTFETGTGTKGAVQIKCAESVAKATIHYDSMLILTKSGNVYTFDSDCSNSTATLLYNDGSYTDVAEGFSISYVLDKNGELS